MRRILTLLFVVAALAACGDDATPNVINEEIITDGWHTHVDPLNDARYRCLTQSGNYELTTWCNRVDSNGRPIP